MIDIKAHADERGCKALGHKCAVITGGAGFIGSHLIEALRARDLRVVVFDSLVNGKHSNVPDDVILIPGDLQDFLALKSVLMGADYVFHLAAVASVPNSQENPRLSYNTNVLGTVNVMEAVRLVCPQAKVVLTSSASVYGTAIIEKGASEEDPLRPESIYAASKVAAETVLSSYHEAYGIDVRTVRFSNVYGPRQGHYVMHDLFHKIQAAHNIVQLIGSGEETRDFIYVKDAVDALIMVCMADAPQFRLFNVATGIPTKIRELAELLAIEMRRSKISFVASGISWPGDINSLLCDTLRLDAVFSPGRTTLREGTQKYVRWAMSSRTNLEVNPLLSVGT